MWPRWSPPGSHVAFFSRVSETGSADDIFVLDLQGGSTQRVTTTPGHDFCPVWAPDGNKLAAVSLGRGNTRRIRILTLAGVILGELAHGMHRVTEPHWSPDGRLLAYAARPTDAVAYDIFVDTIPPDPGP